MTFSGALTLSDLNDFITPSQACIKPVEQKNTFQSADPGAAATQIQIDASGSYYEVSSGDSSLQTQKLQQAEISLNDCLACSGCITSAESVLITLQSHTEVLNFLDSNPPPSAQGHKIPVLSIAPQSLASLAASLASSSGQPSIPLSDVLARVKKFATEHLGFEHVYDTTFARHLSLLEHAQEFEERRTATPSGKPEAPSSVKQADGVDGTCCGSQAPGECSKHSKSGGEGDGDGRLPMLASACPGWVCYAEKAHGEMLPFISRTKSPQAIMGTLVKGWLAQKWGKRPDEIYHVTVMPCYDKKLEASRPDFFDEASNTREVDCVVTTGELAVLIRDKAFDLSLPVSPSPPSVDDLPELLVHLGSTSGSYLHTIISHLMRTSSTPLTLSTAAPSATAKQNADNTEYVLTDAEGTPVFRGATCYGFRNLQNTVRRVARDAGIRVVRGRAAGALKTRTKRGGEGRGYDYVEVMACPGGCVNGGGQLPRAEIAVAQLGADGGAAQANDGDGGMGSKWADRAWTREVERAYWDGRETVGDRFGLLTPPASPKGTVAEVGGEGGACGGSCADEACKDDRCVTDAEVLARSRADKLAVRILGDMCGAPVRRWDEKMDAQGEERRKKFFRTSYRVVESEVLGIGVKW